MCIQLGSGSAGKEKQYSSTANVAYHKHGWDGSIFTGLHLLYRTNKRKTELLLGREKSGYR